MQSTALYLMALDGKFRIDLAIFADTQDEPAAVYQHLHWLRSLAGPPIWVRTAGKLGDDLVAGIDGRGNRFVSIPAFTRNEQGKVGMVRKQCTKTYKIEVCERAIRRELLGLMPKRNSWRPVRRAARVGAQVGEAWKFSKRTDCEWSLSRFGVFRIGLPWQERSP